MLTRESLCLIASTGVGPLDLVRFFAMALVLSDRGARRFDHRANRSLRIPRVRYFNERPSTKSAVVVHRGYPERSGSADFCCLVLLGLARDLDNEIQVRDVR